MVDARKNVYINIGFFYEIINPRKIFINRLFNIDANKINCIKLTSLRFRTNYKLKFSKKL